MTLRVINYLLLIFILTVFGNRLDRGERAGCFTLFVLLLFCNSSSRFLWVSLQCVIVVFPDHSHLLFLSVLFVKNPPKQSHTFLHFSSHPDYHHGLFLSNMQ